jgi:hypothetical protein
MTGRRWILLLGLVAAIVAFLLFRPDKLFVDDVVDEGLADAFAAPVAGQVEPGPSTTVAPTTTQPSGSTTTAGPPTTLPPEPASTALPPEPASTTVPAGPVLEASGDLFGIDHTAAGTASLYQQDGQWVLRFEDDTDIENGPDLYVWLTASTDWEDPGEYIDLGKLKGNVGGQNYPLPPEFDPVRHRNVLIWCLRFQVPFAAAELH